MNAKLCYTLVTFVLAAVTALSAQDLQPIPSEELAKATKLLMEASSRLGDVPLKLELVPDQAIGLKSGDVGAVLIPDRRLKIEKSDKAEKKKNKGAPLVVGQLWTSKLSPRDKGSVVPNERLRLVKVTTKDKELELAVFVLAIEKSGKNTFQLALYGRDSSPVLRVPLTAAKSKGAPPVALAGRKTDEEGGVLELKLLGRFTAEIPVGKQAD
jgi:hypothetical protein